RVIHELRRTRAVASRGRRDAASVIVADMSDRIKPFTVIPAKAGIQGRATERQLWVPAFAGTAEFPERTLAEWRALAEKELGGKSLDTLAWQTPEGIAVKPLYTAEDLEKL